MAKCQNDILAPLATRLFYCKPKTEWVIFGLSRKL
uniref:Uncharacterized protein n=1 Tax=Acinetobacter phage P919 TaxID=3229763 RepID=A0AB39AIP8_9CAUD